MVAEQDGSCAAQAPTVQKVPKTVEVSQLQYIDEIIDEPVQKTVDMPQVQFPDRVTGVPGVSRRHVPSQLIQEEIIEAIRVADSEDLPLNIYREILPENKILRVIKERMTKCVEMLAEVAELSDAYKKFYEQFGERLKRENDEDSTVGVGTADVLKFNTSKPGDKQNNLTDYVDQMKEGQNDISDITGESITVVSSLFEENPRKKGHEENLRNQGFEVPYMAEPMDECAVYQFKESDRAKLNPTTKEGLNLGDVDEKKIPEKLKAELKPPTKLMKHTLADKIEAVTVSDRIVDSPCVPTTSEYGWSAKMGRIMETQGLRDNSMTSHMVSKKTTEVNPTRSIIMELKSRHDLHGHLQQQQQRECSKPQPTKQSTRQERGGERKEEERDQEGRKEEERKVEERGKQVEEDVAGWTEGTRKKRKKMVQIFVKVNGSKTSPMEVSLTDDRVEDVMRQIQKDEDVYVTMHGKVLRRDEKLKSCEVTDGCTVEVTSRMRGGGKHKDKKGKEEKKKQVAQLDDGMCAMACEQMRQVMENLKTLADNSTGEDKRRVVENVRAEEGDNWSQEASER